MGFVVQATVNHYQERAATALQTKRSQKFRFRNHDDFSKEQLVVYNKTNFSLLAREKTRPNGSVRALNCLRAEVQFKLLQSDFPSELELGPELSALTLPTCSGLY